MAVRSGGRRKGQASGGGLGLVAKITLIVGGTVGLLLAVLVAVLLGTGPGGNSDELGLSSSRALATGGMAAWRRKSSSGEMVVRRGSHDKLSRLVRGSAGKILSAYILRGENRVLQGSNVAGIKNFKAIGRRLSLGETRVQAGSLGAVANAKRYCSPVRDEKGDVLGWACVIIAIAPGGGQAGSSPFAGMLIGLSLLVLLCTIAAASYAGTQVTAPLKGLVQAVSRINRGNLHYRTQRRGNDEISRLAKAIEDMTDTLREGEEAHEALHAREEESRLLGELHRALLPERLPVVEGFEVESIHSAGGDGASCFYDAVPLGDGCLAVLVATASGKGAFGALLGAMTRAYLRAYLEESKDAGKALRATNKSIAPGMRKGMNVTAQVAVLDPRGSRATVFIAGHRAPLYSCRGGEISVVHGEGLALGLDKGPVFNKRLEEVVVDMPPGTRLVLTTQGTYEFCGENNENYGVERFQNLVRKHAPKNSRAFLNLVHGELDLFLADNERKSDLTLVTAKRMV